MASTCTQRHIYMYTYTLTFVYAMQKATVFLHMQIHGDMRYVCMWIYTGVVHVHVCLNMCLLMDMVCIQKWPKVLNPKL